MGSGSVPSSITRGRVSAVVLATFFSGAATCGSGSSPTAPVDELGQFTATVSGAVSAQLSGSADALGTASGTPGWALGMTALDGSGGISFVEEGMPRPSPGTYVLASALEHGGNAPNSQFTATVGFPPSSGFGSISGTLTITASSPTSVAGTFDFTAADPEDESRTVSVTGSFNAVNVDF